MASKPILGYWHIRGMAEPIRYLLNYLGVDFEDVTYTQGPAPDYDRSAWTEVRDTLGMFFPNLPYLIDDDLKISESLAIIEYIVLKYKPELAGVTLREKAEIKQIGGVIYDIKNYMSHSCYDPSFNSMKAEVVENVKGELAGISRFLGNKPFLIGERESWPDFTLFEALEMLEALAPGAVHEVSPSLVEYRNRIASLNGVRERVAQPRLPWNNTQAQWL